MMDEELEECYIHRSDLQRLIEICPKVLFGRNAFPSAFLKCWLTASEIKSLNDDGIGVSSFKQIISRTQIP